jgi:hypothetical protein
MGREHEDDMSAEVGETAVGEAYQYAVVAEDVERRDAEADENRLREMEHNLEKAEGDEVDEG